MSHCKHIAFILWRLPSLTAVRSLTRELVDEFVDIANITIPEQAEPVQAKVDDGSWDVNRKIWRVVSLGTRSNRVDFPHRWIIAAALALCIVVCKHQLALLGALTGS